MAHRHRLWAIVWLSWLTAGATACGTESEPLDLGDFDMASKADDIKVVEVPFEVAGDGEVEFLFRTVGLLEVKTEQDGTRSSERLQLVAESPVYQRKSWRGRSPFLNIPADKAQGKMVEYSLKLLNWGSRTAYGVLKVKTELSPMDGIQVVFNRADCDDGCEDTAGELRNEVLKAIQSARVSIDMAMYGLKDPAVIEALCNAVEAGVVVRAVTENDSEDPRTTSSYYPAFFAPDQGLTGCGAQVEPVRSGGIMHHKFLIIDKGQESELLVTGSTNLTADGFERNHNHMVFLRGVPDLVGTFQAEFDQLLGHCTAGRLDDRSCSECTPACTENRAPEGPFSAPNGDGEIHVFFSPADDALRHLRGLASSAYRNDPDPACTGDDADCICRVSGSRWLCAYCALDDGGYGLMGRAEERILMTMFSATDQCFALAWKHAADRGVETVSVWDYVKGGSPYARDDYLCALGLATYVTNWGGRSAQVRNHNKTVVVDDVVFDGSLNISESGAYKNNENTLVIYSPRTAQVFADYVHSEVGLLERSGVTPRSPEECRCSDLVDNDEDGLADEADRDCDGGF